MTGNTENKLSKIKSYNSNVPYQVGVNGVTNVELDDNNVVVSVSYEIDGIKYVSNIRGIEDRQATTFSIYKNKLNELDFSTNGKRRFRNINPLAINRGGNTFFYVKQLDENNSKTITNTNRDDLSTIFILDEQTFNGGYKFFQKLPIFKQEKYNGFIEEPKIESEVFIDRQQTGVFERQQRLEEINTVGDFDTYRNNFYLVKRI